MEQGSDSLWNKLVADVASEEDYIEPAVVEAKEYLQDWWDRYQKAAKGTKFSSHVELDGQLAQAADNLEELMINVEALGRQRLELSLGSEAIEARLLKRAAEDDFYPDETLMLPAGSKLSLTYARRHQNGHLAADMPAERDFYSLVQLYVGDKEIGKVIPIFKMAQVLANGGDLQTVDIAYSPSWPPEYLMPRFP